ncbi:MAG TPA: hypothetical protein VGP47_06205 [Parachlamydiaceae bacterium]|nr:hypothetical protein [Parachlamydiaceae bacterium]
MKIAKYLFIFCLGCCAAATQASADELNAFTISHDRIEALIDDSSHPSAHRKDMAIYVFEKRLNKVITRKQSRINGYLEEIQYLEETLEELRAGELDSSFKSEDEESIAAERLQEENCLLADIEEYLSAIADLDEEVAQYLLFRNKVQDWKNESN